MNRSIATRKASPHLIRKFSTTETQILQDPKVFEHISVLKKAAKLLKEADGIVISAGAGIGVDSGLPDFRGAEGFWKAYPPMKHLGINFQSMANPYWFAKDKELAWGFYGHRLHMYRTIKPHIGFEILKEIALSKPRSYFIFTSNVDGQFQKAGFSEDNIVEIHGSIHHIQCTEPQDCPATIPVIASAENIQVEVDSTSFRAKPETIPKCPHPKCHRIARPNILMFNDLNWVETRTREQQLKWSAWAKRSLIDSDKNVIVEMGAGTDVATVRVRSEVWARDNDWPLIRINPREPEIHHAVKQPLSIPLGSKQALLAIQQLNL